MATYEEIYGKRVKEFDSDPTLDSSYEGQVWYNLASGALKTVVTSFAFRSTTNLPSARNYGTGGGGTQTACWVAGGDLPPFTNETYNYDGSGWTASGNMGDARIRMALGNMGPQTAGLGVGGYSPGVVAGVEEYDGSTWTGGTSLPGALQQAGGAGPQTANIILGGGNPTTSLSYNGSSWSSEGSSSEAFAYYGLAGANSEAALAFYGAEGPPGTNRTTGEEYNGTSWTTVVGTLPNQGNSGGATGTVTSAIFAGNSTTVRSYDGTSITLEPAMSTARGNGYIGGPATNGITSGGSPNTAAAEEFDRSINVFTAAAWSSGTNYPSNLMYAGSAGTKTAAVVYGGATGSPSSDNRTAATNEYDGSSWTGGGALPTVTLQMANLGTQTAAGSFGGVQPPGGTAITTGYEYDGSSWSSGGAIGTAGYNAAGLGTLTAGLLAGGSGDTDYSATYNGSSWTAGPNLNTGRYYFAGSGTTTNAVVFGGQGATAVIANTEEWNGSSWTEVGDLGTARRSQSGAGDSYTSALLYAGYTTADTNICEGWNGTNWSTRPNMAISKRNRAGSGGTSSAIATGGINPVTNNVEEYTDVTETVTSSTLTTS